MKNKKYENYQDFIIAFDSTPEEIIKRETYDLLKLYNQTQQQLQAYKDTIKEAINYIEENSDYEEVGDDYVSNCEKIFEGDVDELLQILNEGE